MTQADVQARAARLSGTCRRLLRALSLFALGGCGAEAPNPYAGTPMLESDTLWRFPSGATAATYLRAEASYLGLLTDSTGRAFVLASGVECSHCDAGLSVLLQEAGTIGTPPDAPVPGWYVYPGEIREETGVPSFRSRLFWGRCLPGRGPGLVQLATEFDTLGRPARERVRLSEIRARGLVDDSVAPAAPVDRTLQASVDRGECREIPPKVQWGL